MLHITIEHRLRLFCYWIQLTISSLANNVAPKSMKQMDLLCLNFCFFSTQHRTEFGGSHEIFVFFHCSLGTKRIPSVDHWKLHTQCKKRKPSNNLFIASNSLKLLFARNQWQDPGCSINAVNISWIHIMLCLLI